RLAGEFTSAFDQMAREAEMEELRKEIEDLKKNNPVADAKRAVDETMAPIKKEFGEEAEKLNKAASGDALFETAQDGAAPTEPALGEPAQGEAVPGEAAKS
ncbi:MAG: hypothetical protein AAFW68_05255, partial [Pseudomonadota bacterium]